MATHQSTWQKVSIGRFPKATKNRHFDVVVIGGGICGLTAAYLLKRSGKRVCVLERDRLGSGDTSRTTAHLTMVTDTRLKQLASVFGKEQARAVWQGGAAAINTIEGIAETEGIECQFQRVPGFLHAALEGRHNERSEQRELEAEYHAAIELGFTGSLVDSVPVFEVPGVRFPNQAKFHPFRYLAGLAQAVDGNGSAIYENSEVDEFAEEKLAVRANGVTLSGDYLIIATHVPLMGQTGMASAALFQTKLVSYSSYAIAAAVPKGRLPEVLLWDTANPYHYLRVDRGRGSDLAIFGGADHKTGQVDDSQERYARLEKTLRRFVPEAKVREQWSGQVVETNDGLPYIGETAKRQFVATGFAGNGMTFGTLAAMMAADRVLGRQNAWQDLFDVNRKKLRGGVWRLLKENLDYPYYLLRDRLPGGKTAKSPQALRRNQGSLVTIDGKQVACSKDAQGRLHQVSAVCTHLGCLVHWNDAESTWDCPCHGSRFRPDGTVLAGPAESPLEPVAEKASARRTARSTNGHNRAGRPAHSPATASARTRGRRPVRK